ncbi:MAG TPA: GPR endopeptidase, partial [Syntrophomonas sp.]|nr:GPR endopeptidase [Syntrophomonas sp.]
MLYKDFNIYVDMAIEARDLIRGTTDQEIPGVQEDVQQLEHIKVTTITILNASGAEKIGRPIGTYVTIESPPLKINDPYVRDEIVAQMEKSMQTMIGDHLKP